MKYKIDSTILLFYLLSFERSKERSKEKSPASDTLPEILSYWLKKFQLTTRQKSTVEWLKQEIFSLRQYLEFLSAMYHRRESKKLICNVSSISTLNDIDPRIMINNLQTTK